MFQCHFSQTFPLPAAGTFNMFKCIICDIGMYMSEISMFQVVMSQYEKQTNDGRKKKKRKKKLRIKTLNVNSNKWISV